MKRALKFLASGTTWFVLGCLVGTYQGGTQGYARGVANMIRLILELRETPPEPPRFTKGDI